MGDPQNRPGVGSLRAALGERTPRNTWSGGVREARRAWGRGRGGAHQRGDGPGGSGMICPYRGLSLMGGVSYLSGSSPCGRGGISMGGVV